MAAQRRNSEGPLRSSLPRISAAIEALEALLQPPRNYFRDFFTVVIYIGLTFQTPPLLPSKNYNNCVRRRCGAGRSSCRSVPSDLSTWHRGKREPASYWWREIDPWDTLTRGSGCWPRSRVVMAAAGISRSFDRARFGRPSSTAECPSPRGIGDMYICMGR